MSNIRFGKANVGNFVGVETLTGDITLTASGNNNVMLSALEANVSIQGGDVSISEPVGNAGVDVNNGNVGISGPGYVNLDSGDMNVRIDSAGVAVAGDASQKVGFFGTTPVGQQTTPSTLGDVIALLQAFGLCT